MWNTWLIDAQNIQSLHTPEHFLVLTNRVNPFKIAVLLKCHCFSHDKHVSIYMRKEVSLMNLCPWQETRICTLGRPHVSFFFFLS